MARCPHCNLVLSSDEARRASCPVCSGALNGEAPATETPPARTSFASSPETSQTEETTHASPESNVATSTRPISPWKLALAAAVAVWLVLAMAWISGGSSLATPPRLLGLALLGVPVLTAVLARTNAKEDEEP